MPQHRPHRPPTNGTGHGRTRPRQAGLSDQTQRVSEPSVEWCTGFAPAVAFPEADPKSCESISPRLPYMPRWTGERSSKI